MVVFGREDIGETVTATASGTIRGSVYTSGVAGTLDTIDIYLDPIAAGDIKALMYLHSDLSLKATSTARTFAAADPVAWYSFTFAGETVLAATAYILCVFPDIQANYYRFNDAEANCFHYQNVVYPNAPDPLVPTHLNHQMSIHAHYTATAAGPKKGNSLVSTMINMLNTKAFYSICKPQYPKFAPRITP